MRTCHRRGKHVSRSRACRTRRRRRPVVTFMSDPARSAIGRPMVAGNGEIPTPLWDMIKDIDTLGRMRGIKIKFMYCSIQVCRCCCNSPGPSMLHISPSLAGLAWSRPASNSFKFVQLAACPCPNRWPPLAAVNQRYCTTSLISTAHKSC
jgi:hypothetical protein